MAKPVNEVRTDVRSTCKVRTSFEMEVRHHFVYRYVKVSLAFAKVHKEKEEGLTFHRLGH